MRSQRIFTLVLVALMVFGASVWSWAQMAKGAARSFGYSGHLQLDGAAVMGPHDFRFVLVSTASGNNSCVATSNCAGQVFSGDIDDVSVTNGAFSVEVGPVPEATLLGSDDLYIGVAVREAGSADPYVPLAGRQRILAAPFAARAASAKNYRMTGTAQIDGADIVAADIATANIATANIATANIDAGNVSGSLSFGSQSRQMLNLWGDDYAFGIQAGTLYQRTGERVAWFQGGDHAGGALDPGTGGTLLMSLDGAGLSVAGDLTVDGTGGFIPGRVIGGAQAVCTSNGQTYKSCLGQWGTASCSGSGCNLECSSGTKRYTSQAIRCFGGVEYDARCDSIICVE